MRLNKKRLAALAMSAVMAASAVPFQVGQDIEIRDQPCRTKSNK